VILKLNESLTAEEKGSSWQQ